MLLTVDGMLMIDPCFAEERFMRNFRTRCWRPEKIQNHQMSRYRLCIKVIYSTEKPEADANPD